MPQEVVVRPKLSVIVPMSSPHANVGQCLASLDRSAAPAGYELILVVDGPGMAGPALPDREAMVVEAAAPPGTLAALDVAARRAQGEWLLLLDPSIRLSAGCFEPLAATLEEGGVGAVQPKVVGSDGRLWSAGGLVGPLGDLAVYGAGHEFPDAPAFSARREVDFAGAGCILLKRAALEAAGGLARGHRSRRYEEADLAFALRAAGFTVGYEPRSRVIAAAGLEEAAAYPDDRERFAARWAETLAVLPPDTAGPDDRAYRPSPGGGRTLSILFVEPGGDEAGHSGLGLARRLRRDGHFVATFTSKASDRRRWADLLAAEGIPCFGPDPLCEPRDPAVAARWRRAQGAALPGILARYRFDTVVVAADSLGAALPFLETFAAEATIVADLGRPDGLDLRSLADLVARRRRPDRILCSEDAAGDLASRLTGVEIVGLPEGAGREDDGSSALLTAALGPRRRSRPEPVGPDTIPPPRAGLVTIVVEAGERPEATRSTLESVRQYSDRPVEVIVVDGGPSAGRRQWLARQAGVAVLPGGVHATFAEHRNQALAAARGEFIVLLEDGVRVPRRWLSGLVAPFGDPRVGAVGPRFGGDGGPQGIPAAPNGSPSDFARWAETWRREHRGQTVERERLDWFCLALRTAAVRAAGGFDESFETARFAVADLGARLRDSGWSLMLAEEVLLRRASGLAGEPAYGCSERDRSLFQQTHPGQPAVSGEPFLSACMIVKDEEERLPECLVSIRGLVDEVVVVDTGSSDVTRQLARAAGCQVVDAPWNDDFAAARNVSLDAATGKWALTIDADERAEYDDPAAFRAFLARSDVDLVLIPHRSPIGDTDDAPVTEHEETRLYVRGKFRYVGKLHEQITRLDGARMSGGRTRQLSLRHEGYRPSVFLERGKQERNERIAKANYDEAIGERWFRAYNAARSSTDALEQIRLFQEVLEHIPDHHQNHKFDAMCGLARAQLDADRPDEALFTARRAVAQSPRAGLGRYLTGVSLNRVGHYQEAVAVLEELVAEDGDAEDLDGLFKNGALRKAMAPVELALAHGNLGDYETMAARLSQVIERDPEGFLDWRLVVTALQKANPRGWIGDAVRLGRRAPKQFLAAMQDLPPADRLGLLEGVVESGAPLSAGAALYAALELIPALVDEAARAAALRRWSPCLAGITETARVFIARRLEGPAPASALWVWESLGDGPGAAVGRSRCHAAMGSLAAAVEALDDADLSGMTPADTLFVATLALEAGDPETATTVLSTLPPRPAGLAPQDILRVATAIGPDAVAAVRRHVLVGA